MAQITGSKFADLVAVRQFARAAVNGTKGL